MKNFGNSLTCIKAEKAFDEYFAFVQPATSILLETKFRINITSWSHFHCVGPPGLGYHILSRATSPIPEAVKVRPHQF